MRTLLVPGLRRPLPVGRILCIGRNNAAHAAEMRSAVPEEPMVFLKPSTALVGSGEDVVIPTLSSDVRCEVELVVVIRKVGRNIAERDAPGYIAGLDMTARDLQSPARERGHPWAVAKGFDTFAPPVATIDDWPPLRVGVQAA